MDPDIIFWILEFLLRSSVPDLLLKKVLKSLPLSRIDSRLWKTLALRSIQSEVAMASFTENSLECLEVIEEIDRLDGIAITQAMKEAYCAVAVECSVRHLGACPDKNTRGLFDDAVNRIWRGRVRQMMEAMALGRRSNLFTPELIGWKDLLESARWDAEVCGRLMNMSTRQNAIDEVRVYLKETWESMGPSFLELADILSQDKGLGSSRGDQMSDAELAANIPNEGCDRGVSESVLVSDQMNLYKEGLHCSTNTTQKGLVVSDGSALNNAAICMEKAPVAGGNQESEQLGKGVLTQRINEGMLFFLKGLGSSRGDQMSDAELAANIPYAGCDRGVSESVLVSDQMNLCKEGLHCSTNTTQKGLVVSDGSALNNAAICMEKAPVAGGNQESEQLGKRVLPQRINEAIQKGKLPIECNHAVPSTRRGVKIIDAEEEGPATVCSKDHNASNIQVEKLRKSLMSSSLELRALVKDPLPDALHKSDIVRSELATKGVNQEPPLENQSSVVNVPEQNTCRSMVLYQPINDILKKQSAANCSNVQRPSLMERNSTAHTFEWNDPFNDLPGGSPKKRRRKARWSSEEEDALRDGVKKFGRGNWKPILRFHSEIFAKAGRTEVDLKDKWRNLTRSS